MKFSIDKRERYLTFKLEEAKLNSLIAPSLKSEFVILKNEGYRNMIIDLTEVQFVDSSGLAAILVGNRMCKEDRGSFVLIGITPPVLKLIKISQLDRVLAIAPSESEASDLILMNEVQREIENEDKSEGARES